jgi:hypothetical protein
MHDALRASSAGPPLWRRVIVAVAGVALWCVPMAVAAGFVEVARAQSGWPTVDAVVVSSSSTRWADTAAVAYEVEGQRCEVTVSGTSPPPGATIDVAYDPDDVCSATLPGNLAAQLWHMAVPILVLGALAAIPAVVGWMLVRSAVRGHAPVTGAPAVVVALDGAAADTVAAVFDARPGGLDRALVDARRAFLAARHGAGTTGPVDAAWSAVRVAGDLLVVVAYVGVPSGVTVDDAGQVDAESTAALRAALVAVHPLLGAATPQLWVDATLIDSRPG